MQTQLFKDRNVMKLSLHRGKFASTVRNKVISDTMARLITSTIVPIQCDSTEHIKKEEAEKR